MTENEDRVPESPEKPGPAGGPDPSPPSPAAEAPSSPPAPAPAPTSSESPKPDGPAPEGPKPEGPESEAPRSEASSEAKPAAASPEKKGPKPERDGPRSGDDDGKAKKKRRRKKKPAGAGGPDAPGGGSGRGPGPSHPAGGRGRSFVEDQIDRDAEKLAREARTIPSARLRPLGIIAQEVRRMAASGDPRDAREARRALVLMKSKVAFLAGREQGRERSAFVKVRDTVFSGVDALTRQRETPDPLQLRNFLDHLEAFVGYHRFHSDDRRRD